jgi:endonuclease YncB( thermonuclease family)
MAFPSTSTDHGEPMSSLRRLCATALAATTLALVPLAPAGAASVAYVVDGDTIRLSSGTYVRLIGIDTPEVGQCGYDAAKALLDEMVGLSAELPNPASVDDRDRYGRLLRYVRVGGRDAGLVLVRRGLAKARYDSLDGYDWHPLQGRYRAADATSRDVC